MAHVGAAERRSSVQWSGLTPQRDPYRALVDGIRDYGIYLLDEGGIVQTWNVGASLITGYTAEEIIGRQHALLYTQAEQQRRWPQRTLDLARRSRTCEDEGWRVHKNGQRFWASIVTTAVYAPDGSVCGFAKILRDLTRRKHREEAMRRGAERFRQLSTQAIKDPLTGAFNRHHLNERVGHAAGRAGQVPASIVLFDIDHFKGINDRLGHIAGDIALTGVAGIARRLSRDSDMLFRIGGDEFLMLLPGISKNGARAIAERLRCAVERSRLVDTTVTLSLGVAELENNDTQATWIERADRALYKAKRAGRNRVA